MTSLSENIILPPSLDDVEALAAVQAIHFALDLGLTDVILEGDYYERPHRQPVFGVGPNLYEWVESCYCFSKWKFN